MSTSKLVYSNHNIHYIVILNRLGGQSIVFRSQTLSYLVNLYFLLRTKCDRPEVSFKSSLRQFLICRISPFTCTNSSIHPETPQIPQQVQNTRLTHYDLANSSRCFTSASTLVILPNCQVFMAGLQ